MILRLYNTLTRTKEVFTPIDPKNVRMYVCGPTVYDFAHIGNARPVIVFDVLFRLLRHLYGPEHVTYVRNITDVDDKINARALRDFPDLPLNDAIRRVTEKTANQFHSDVKALGCLEPTHEPRATDFVLKRPDGKFDMVGLIQSLIDKDHAYLASGEEGREVLFDIASMPEYGQLSNRRLDEQVAGARVEVKDHKRNPGDFVLWKESGAKQPGWNGEFEANPKGGWEAVFKITEENRRAIGANSRSVTIHGRPGWHIECSAMSAAYLDKTFDIHGGGLDLIFPHHENELAQSRCAFGTNVMANIWMHNGFLQVEGQKMSKSLGNFYTIHELLDTTSFGGSKWPGELLRLAMLKTHYRQPIDWTLSSLQEASQNLHDLYVSWQFQNTEVDESESSVLKAEIVNALFDDLNSVRAINFLVEQVTGLTRKDFESVLNLIGLDLEKYHLVHHVYPGLKMKESVEPLIAARLEARKAKNWAESDRIRDELAAMGIAIKDNKDGTTSWEVKR